MDIRNEEHALPPKPHKDVLQLIGCCGEISELSIGGQAIDFMVSAQGFEPWTY